MQINLFEENANQKTEKISGLEQDILIYRFEKAEITSLNYAFYTTNHGEILIASSEKGIFWLAFVTSWREGLIELSESFPMFTFTEKSDVHHQAALKIIAGKKLKKKIKLFVTATNFQLVVWRELLKTPFGVTRTYSEISEKLNLPKGAARAVGTAIGKNPIAILIPCHRIVPISGKLGGYRWGVERKREILMWEHSTYIK